MWSVPSAGGTARLLVASGGVAHRPRFSPDGKRLAFYSAQPGASGIYVLTLDGGALRRLTHDDAVTDLSGWSADGRAIYFTSVAHNIAYFNDIMRVAADGGTPMQALHEDYVMANAAAPSPDGASIAFVRNGYTQWWRRGHSHMDQSEIVVAHPAAKRFDTVTDGVAKDQWPMWSPDGRTLYFVSDRSGSDELWAHGADGRLRQLTSLHGGRVLWPSISQDGRLIAFERAMKIWTYDLESGATRELAIAPRGLPDVVGERHLTLTNRFTSLSLAPDGKKIAFVGRARVFAASAQDGGDAQLVTPRGDAAYDLPVWAAGSRRVAYVIDRGAEQAVATYEFPDGPEHVVTPAGHHDDYPHWSPDGKSLAFVRDGRELHLLDLATRADRVLAARDHGPPAVRRPRRHRVLAGRRLDRVRRSGPRRLQQRLCRAHQRRAAARAHVLGERQRWTARVVAGRHAPVRRHLAAHRAGSGRASRPHPAHPALPRGRVPQAVSRGAAPRAALAHGSDAGAEQLAAASVVCVAVACAAPIAPRSTSPTFASASASSRPASTSRASR